MTTTLSVRCQNCGSPLSVSDGVRNLTCGYCHSELQVVRDASTVHTEVLQRIEQNTQSTVNQLKVLEIQNDLDRLDREWEQRSRGLMSITSTGAIIAPSAAQGVMQVVAGTTIGLSFLVRLGGPHNTFSLIVLPAAAAILYLGIRSIQKAGKLKELRSAYASDRDHLLSELAQARAGHAPAAESLSSLSEGRLIERVLSPSP